MIEHPEEKGQSETLSSEAGKTSTFEVN